MAEGLTLFKLIILYMLRKVNFPLTNTQITELMIEREYTDYFHVQEALSDLVEARLVSVEKIRNMSQYTATIDGEKTLEYFTSEIPYAIKREIDQYLRENAYELRNESCMTADYALSDGGGYVVTCRVNEGRETVIALSVSVPTEDEAERVCEKWPDKAQQLYLEIMTQLL